MPPPSLNEYNHTPAILQVDESGGISKNELDLDQILRQWTLMPPAAASKVKNLADFFLLSYCSRNLCTAVDKSPFKIGISDFAFNLKSNFDP